MYADHILEATESHNDDETNENLYYPFYDKLLNHLFPGDHYDVCPQWQIPNTRFTVDFTVRVRNDPGNLPLLLVEIKPPSHFHSVSRRRYAMEQVIRRLDQVGPTNQHAQRLYAISAIGLRWRASYARMNNGSRNGRGVRNIAAISSLRSAALGCWSPNITSEPSFIALQNIVEIIGGYVNDLN
ncbi:hypothetical protein V8E53_005154 [Lactarius tabidus]